MLDDATTATAEATETVDFYDTLKPTEQEVFDLVSSLGFRPDKNDAGEWFGLSINGDESIGPKKSLSDLCSSVQAHVAKLAEEQAAEEPEADDLEDGQELLEEDHAGNRFLPGTEPIVDQQIAAAAGKYHALKTERVEMLRKELDAKDELITICHQKKDLFKPDPDNSNAKVYKVGDLVIRIANEWKEKITTEIKKDEA